MSELTLEQRVSTLEKLMAELARERAGAVEASLTKWWEPIAGIMNDVPETEEMRAVREYIRRTGDTPPVEAGRPHSRTGLVGSGQYRENGVVTHLLDTDTLSVWEADSGPDHAVFLSNMSARAKIDVGVSVVSFQEQALGCHDYLSKAKTPADLVKPITIASPA